MVHDARLTLLERAGQGPVEGAVAGVLSVSHAVVQAPPSATRTARRALPHGSGRAFLREGEEPTHTATARESQVTPPPYNPAAVRRQGGGTASRCIAGEGARPRTTVRDTPNVSLP